MTKMGLNFDEFRKANVLRCEDAFFELDHWSPQEWSNALAGEVGEACNITKKMLRGDHTSDGSWHEALAKELADVVTYADLLAARCGIDLGEAVRDKFNEVSRRRNSSIFL